MTEYNPPMLVDLVSDLGEKKNLSAEHPEKVEQLLREMKAFGK